MQAQAQTFTGTSMRSVLNEVKDVFGRDALILKQETRFGRVRVDAAPSADKQPPVITPVQRESLVEAAQKPVASALSQSALRSYRLAGYSDELLEVLPPSFVQSHTEIVSNLLRHLPRMENIPAIGSWTFVGPPGSGKTSMVIRLAALARKRDARLRIGIVTTHSRRLSGGGELVGVAEVLGATLHRVQPQNLPDFLESDAREELLLIDGGEVAPATDRSQVVLTLPATLQREVMKMAQAKAGAVNALALTQLDRVPVSGPAMSYWHESGLRLALISNSHNVARPPRVPDVETLVPIMLKGVERS